MSKVNQSFKLEKKIENTNKISTVEDNVNSKIVSRIIKTCILKMTKGNGEDCKTPLFSNGPIQAHLNNLPFLKIL